MILPVYSAPHPECCSQFWAPQDKRYGAPGRGPAEGKKDDLRTGASLLQGKVEGAGCVQLQEEKTHQCLSVSDRRVLRGGTRFFSEVLNNRTRNNGQKLIDRKFPLNMRKSLTMWVTVHWEQTAREVV